MVFQHAKAFERYDLVSAPVVDPDGRLVGRVTVNEVLDYIREEAEQEQLAHAGLQEEEDIFASVWDSVKNRWAWLAVNLVTAFLASRVIGCWPVTGFRIQLLAVLMQPCNHLARPFERWYPACHAVG